jgi:penicillin-binding protein 1C
MFKNILDYLLNWVKTYPRSLIFIFMLLGLGYWFCLPSPLFDRPYSFVLEDKHGHLLGARIAADGQWRFPPVDTIPEKFASAIVAFEDHRFYRHPGVDPVGIGRAIVQNIKERKVVSGGSTISMQVIRLAKRNPPRTVIRKIQEIILATRLELTYSKSNILALYSANAPFGGNTVGLEAASWRYFGKPPALLSWGEASMLAVLPNSPALIHPGRNREALLAKRNRLLARLLEMEKIDATTYELAIEEPLPVAPHPLPRIAPHLLDRVYLEMGKNASVSRFRSSLDMPLQQQIDRILQSHHQQLRQNEIHNLAALVLDVESGKALAYIGNVRNAGEQHAEQVDIITAPRSTGSILKPFLYARAIQEGLIIPQSILEDIPTQMGGYRPENFNEEYDGMVRAERALIRSLNIPFVRLLQKYGLEKFHHHLQGLGMTTLHPNPRHYGLPLIVGGAEGNLWEITNAYACMGRMLGHHYRFHGEYATSDFRPAGYLEDKEWDNSLAEISLQQQPPVFSAAATWLTFEAMQQVERPNAEGDWQYFESSKPIAWKTGTSFGFRDAWAIGINPSYAVGVWVGNADGEGRPGLIGIKAAAPVLFDIFNRLPGDNAWFEPPGNDMRQVSICGSSGFRPGRFCPADTVRAASSSIKLGVCPYHQPVQLDESGQWQVHAGCASPLKMTTTSFFVLPPVEEYYYRKHHPNYELLPPFRTGCQPDETTVNMQLIYPKQLTQIYVPVDLDGRLSKTVFKVAHRSPGNVIHWHIDEAYIGQTKDFHSMELAPSVGKHKLVLVDEKGERLERSFEIIGKE